MKLDQTSGLLPEFSCFLLTNPALSIPFYKSSFWSLSSSSSLPESSRKTEPTGDKMFITWTRKVSDYNQSESENWNSRWHFAISPSVIKDSKSSGWDIEVFLHFFVHFYLPCWRAGVCHLLCRALWGFHLPFFIQAVGLCLLLHIWSHLSWRLKWSTHKSLLSASLAPPTAWNGVASAVRSSASLSLESATLFCSSIPQAFVNILPG